MAKETKIGLILGEDTKVEFDKPEPAITATDEEAKVEFAGIDKSSNTVHLKCVRLEGKKVSVWLNDKVSGNGIVKDGRVSVRVSGSLSAGYALKFLF